MRSCVLINLFKGGDITMSQETKYCKHCGQIIDADCVVCPKCGKQVEELQYAKHDNIIINNNNNASSSAAAASFISSNTDMISPKSWLTTLLLCLFLGGIGIHRFYVGKIGTGILMILLLFTGISSVWALIDFILIILSKFKDKQGRPIKR